MRYRLLAAGLLAAVISNAQSNIGMQQTFSQYAQTTSTESSHFGNMSSLSRTEGVEGSPVLLPSWTSGKIFMVYGAVMEEPAQALNYNKMDKGLIVKISDNQMLTVDMGQIDHFVLKMEDSNVTFRPLPGPAKVFAQEIYAGPKYSVYKSVTTKFMKADYQNKGMYESGSKFDRYIDETTYYIFSGDGKSATIVKGDRKEIKKAKEQIPQIGSFFDKNSMDNTNADKVMKDLGVFLNQ